MQPDHMTTRNPLQYFTKPDAAVLKKSNALEITMLIIRVSLVVAIAACLIVRYSKTANTVTASISDNSIRLTADQMSVIVKELLSPQQQQELASDPERRKDFAKHIKELLALGQAAESEGLAKTEEVKAQIDFQTSLELKKTYEKKNPSAFPTDEEVKAYYQAHPNDWDAFLSANPDIKQRAQGPQAEGIKKEYGQIKLFADRARKAGLEQDEGTKLRILIGRNQILSRAYVNHLQKNIDKLVTDADIEAYYNDHKDEFEEVRVRHILVSTREEPVADGGPARKPPSKDEARKKAQSLLDLIRKGEDFVRLAQKSSDDPRLRAKGGDMDFVGKGMRHKPFEDAAFALKPGEVSDVVETDLGFHIIKGVERRIASISDNSTRQKVRQKLQLEMFKKEINRIYASGKVEVSEDFQIVEPVVKPKTGNN